MMFATDTVALGDVRVNDAGYLEAFARTARTGVQQYLGAEMGRPDLGVVNVYRDEADVFSKASLHSFAQIPLTVDHPPEAVNATNWRKYAVGTTGSDVLRDGEHLKIGLKIKDAAAIAAVNSGKRELSVGYTTELVWENGVAPDGTPYQAKQTAIVADHIAIVTSGRAGAQCRIGDSWAALSTETAPNPPPKDRSPSMKTLVIDGHTVELSDAAIIAVGHIQKQLGTLTADNLKLTSDVNTLVADHAKAMIAKDAAHADVLKAKDTELATKDAEIEKLRASQIDDAKLDELATARADVIGKAKAIVADAKTDGVSIPAIRRSIVAAKLGDAAIADRSDDYVSARFDILVEASGRGDALGRSTAATPPRPTSTHDHIADPQARRIANLRDAWKQPAA